MKKVINLIKNSLNSNKKFIYFLLLFSLLGIVAGSLFVLFLNNSDKTIVINYITDFINNIKNNKINLYNNFISLYLPNMFNTMLIWVLGISIIAVPIILFIYFSKMFVLGFTVASFILKYKFMGVIYCFLYLFPVCIIEILIYLVLINYSFTLSLNLFKSFFKKGNINFKPIMKRYVFILLLTLLILFLTSLFEVTISPIILRFILK